MYLTVIGSSYIGVHISALSMYFLNQKKDQIVAKEKENYFPSTLSQAPILVYRRRIFLDLQTVMLKGPYLSRLMTGLLVSGGTILNNIFYTSNPKYNCKQIPRSKFSHTSAFSVFKHKIQALERCSCNKVTYSGMSIWHCILKLHWCRAHVRHVFSAMEYLCRITSVFLNKVIEIIIGITFLQM